MKMGKIHENVADTWQMLPDRLIESKGFATLCSAAITNGTLMY